MTPPPSADDHVGSSLLRAASEILASDGPSALTVRNIAQRAGVSTINVYSRYGGKDGIVDALYAEGYEELARAIESVPRTDDPEADLRACAEAYRRFALEHPSHYSVCLEAAYPDHTPSDRARGFASGAFDRLAARVARCIERWSPVSVDTLVAATVIWAGLHGIVSLELQGIASTVGSPDTFDTMLSSMIDGLRSRTADDA